MSAQKIYQFFSNIFDVLDKWLSPLWFLYVRYWLGKAFFKSGLVSISDWKGNVDLFRYEFKVPIIPPEIAAFTSTAVELICPIMLIFGVGTRIGALGILSTAVIIELTYIHHLDHILWILASSLLILKGAEKISIDYILSKSEFKDFRKKNNKGRQGWKNLQN